MIKRENIKFIATHDEGFGEPIVEDTVIFAEEIVAEYKGYDMLTFRVMPEPIAEKDNVLDLARCKILRVDLEGGFTDEELDFMSKAKFVDVIRRFAK
ncbi:hypothetical protein H9655_21155 [Cytobacillus sp. Sa5YUA1]|uniref:Uncharacterized protein n=1 Tax=Cytobacillus stercorigallinarum TaxID=2762240 RepID=A0ABR8QVK1_9BACI|nr:hypothetical protein [Cytobacillus stercorigallinarum]MBD7939555.1 hypothetical protein [Cytobacillus stercorigallinarum]